MLAMVESWPFLPEVRLFHDAGKAEKFIRERMDKVPLIPASSASAQTWYDEGIAAVLMKYSGPWHTEAALLVHEAVHIVLHHFDFLGEEHPQEEFIAYGVQAVSRELFEAQEKWERKHG